VPRCEPICWCCKSHGQVSEDSLAQSVAAVLEVDYGLLVRCEWRGEGLLNGVVGEWLAHVEGSAGTKVVSSLLLEWVRR
jgi:hypothetical protein